MKYLDKRFSVFMSGDKRYEENYDRIFGKKFVTPCCGEVIKIKDEKQCKCPKCGNVIIIC